MFNFLSNIDTTFHMDLLMYISTNVYISRYDYVSLCVCVCVCVCTCVCVRRLCLLILPNSLKSSVLTD